MNKNYVKPVVMLNNDLAEGVYLASGNSCYTIKATIIHQTPTTGRENYTIQISAVHNADHTRDQQTLYVNFNQPVNYVSCNANGASLAGGDGTSTLAINLGYHQNPSDNIGFGDLVVTSEDGLAIMGARITD